MSVYTRTHGGHTMTVHAPEGEGDFDPQVFERFASSDPVLGLDVETRAIVDGGPGHFGPDAGVRLVQFGTPTTAWVLNPLVPAQRRAIEQVLSDPGRKFTTHTNYDPLALWSAFAIALGQRVVDAHLLSKLVEPDEKAGHGLDNGELYRRHVTRPTRDELVDEVRRLEKQRDAGSARQPGKPRTVEKWLWHWVENIAKPTVSDNTYDGYEVAVRVHLVPGIGKHRLDRLQPEHLESLYRRMQANGARKAGTAHQAHRTVRTALGEAVRRGYTAKNAAALAKPPRMEEDEAEVEPYTVEEVQRLLLEANKRRNTARWMLALALGLRQGETLGLRWSDVDLDNEYLKLRRNRLRPRYQHGCPEASSCGRKPGYCPDRVQVRRETKNTKSRAGRRAVPLPGLLVAMLRAHAETQEQERKAAGDLWAELGYVFTKLLGGPLSPNTDYHDWKRLLEDAGVRNARLHDARHTAATVLMLLGVPDRVIDQIMGWEPGTSASMRARYLHVPDAMLKDVARKIADAIWGPPETPPVDKNQDNGG